MTMPTRPSPSRPDRLSRTDHGHPRVTRAAEAGALILGPLAGAWLAHPIFGMVITAIESAVVLALLGTALFGSNRHSQRAFRLLRWISNTIG